jgi:hypothetical protein
MDCAEIQELILESLDQPPAAAALAAGQEVDAHLTTCAACAAFAGVQRALDRDLGVLLAAPAVPRTLRAGLRERIRREPPPPRSEALPDIVHFAAFGVATLLSAAVLPIAAPIVVGAGVTLAIAGYVVLSAVRGALESD